MRTARARMIECTNAVIVKSAGFAAVDRQVVRFRLVSGERTHAEIRRGLIPDSGVARHADVVIGDERQPCKIVGEARTNAATARLMPPMLDVSFSKLPAGGAKEMRTR